MINPAPDVISPPAGKWLRLDEIAEVELTSEDPAHPIEAALGDAASGGWRAAGPGPQTIRLRFDRPTELHQVRLQFREPRHSRTQEFVLRVGSDSGAPAHEVVRQQFNFHPGATVEEEDYHVHLPQVVTVELIIVPDISGGDAPASLEQLRLG